MARIKNNPLVKGASGKVAGDIVYKTYYDNTFLSWCLIRVKDKCVRLLPRIIQHAVGLFVPNILMDSFWYDKLIDTSHAHQFYIE